jgi:hypothetical protein
MRRVLCVIETRPDIRANLATNGADEQRLEIGQPDIIGPSFGADRRRVAAMIMRAGDQQPAHAGAAHFAERDFLGAGRHLAKVIAATSSRTFLGRCRRRRSGCCHKRHGAAKCNFASVRKENVQFAIPITVG